MGQTGGSLPIGGATTSDPFSRAGLALIQNILSAMASRQDAGLPPPLQAVASDPSKLAALQQRYSEQHLALWNAVTNGAAAALGPAANPGDRRFSSAAWGGSPFYDYLRRSYLINARYLAEFVEALDVEARTRERLRFVTRQFVDAMSPANFAATNPDAIRLALQTKGESLSLGIRNLIGDVQKGRISTTDEAKFEVGRNIAITEGAVVFENELLQLIQYRPLTAKVHKRPLVIIPPCINKYYVLDLQPENSFVRYAVEQGHTVFMVSWRNILPEQGHFTWDDYLRDGLIAAIDAARAICRVQKVNALGFCVGGTLLGAALAVLAARGEDKVESVTFFASMLDFSETGDIGLFVDEASLAAREAQIGKGGVFPGQQLALLFSALRANDLVWSYVVNNYLKGGSPEAFDILFWNADSTNLPGPWYCYYVRNTYLENNLRVPGKLSMLGVPVDLGRVRLPTFILATREDHIVPWKTAYRTTRLLGGEMRFVLGASGHIAGVINPPSQNRRSYWSGDTFPGEPEAWLELATERRGSWWPDWNAWLARFGGGEKKAPARPGSAKFRPIEPAPGRYVKLRVV